MNRVYIIYIIYLQEYNFSITNSWLILQTGETDGLIIVVVFHNESNNICDWSIDIKCIPNTIFCHSLHYGIITGFYHGWFIYLFNFVTY